MIRSKLGIKSERLKLDIIGSLSKIMEKDFRLDITHITKYSHTKSLNIIKFYHHYKVKFVFNFYRKIYVWQK